MRFVHTADWQLGMTRHFLAGEAQPQYSAARRDAVAGLGPLAAASGAEFVVVSGDVFEDNQLAPKIISQSLEAMRAIGIPVPGQRAGAGSARRPRGSAGLADRRGALAVETADDRPGCRRA
jgi:DNA repair exonuclease SbcCD nuclease subunit